MRRLFFVVVVFVLYCFVFFCFSRFKTTQICFGSTKMEIFYREKAFHAGKKIRKNDFPPSEKFSCYHGYAPVDSYNHKHVVSLVKPATTPFNH